MCDAECIYEWLVGLIYKYTTSHLAKVARNAFFACMGWIRKGEREAVRAWWKVELVLVKHENARASDGTRVCWLEWKERLYG
jgi:hypothetical protein